MENPTHSWIRGMLLPFTLRVNIQDDIAKGKYITLSDAIITMARQYLRTHKRLTLQPYDNQTVIATHVQFPLGLAQKLIAKYQISKRQWTAMIVSILMEYYS